MFKAGDKVRVLRHRNCYGEDSPGYGIPRGAIVTLRNPDRELKGDGFVMFGVEDMGDGASWLIRSDDIELVNQSPVREVMRREIVPGVYGRIEIIAHDKDNDVHMRLVDRNGNEPYEEDGTMYFNAYEIGKLIHTLSLIREEMNNA